MDRVKLAAVDHQADPSDADPEAVSSIELTHPVMVGDDWHGAAEWTRVPLILALDRLLLPPTAVLGHSFHHD